MGGRSPHHRLRHRRGGHASDSPRRRESRLALAVEVPPILQTAGSWRYSPPEQRFGSPQAPATMFTPSVSLRMDSLATSTLTPALMPPASCEVADSGRIDFTHRGESRVDPDRRPKEPRCGKCDSPLSCSGKPPRVASGEVRRIRGRTDGGTGARSVTRTLAIARLANTHRPRRAAGGTRPAGTSNADWQHPHDDTR